MKPNTTSLALSRPPIMPFPFPQPGPSSFQPPVHLSITSYVLLTLPPHHATVRFPPLAPIHSPSASTPLLREHFLPQCASPRSLPSPIHLSHHNTLQLNPHLHNTPPSLHATHTTYPRRGTPSFSTAPCHAPHVLASWPRALLVPG